VILRHFGLDKQVKIQPAATNEGILAVIERGDAAAGIMSPPTNVKASQDGLKELANGPQLGVPMVHAGVTVTRDYLKNNPNVVKAFVQGYLEGWTFAIDPANKAAMVATIEKWTKTDAATATAAYDFVFPAWAKDKVPAVNPAALQTILDITDNPKAQTAKPDQFIDNSLIQAASKG